jgi:hypothetical protein
VRLKDFAHTGNLQLQCWKSQLGWNRGYLDSRLTCLLEGLGGDGQQGCGCCCCDLRPLFHDGWLLCRGGKFGEFGVVVDDNGCPPLTVPPGVAGGLWRLGVVWFGSLVFCAVIWRRSWRFVPSPIAGESASSLGSPMMGTLRVFCREALCCRITLMLSWGEGTWAYPVGIKSRCDAKRKSSDISASLSC